MDKALERLGKLFEKNEQWWDDNPSTPGDENPYPDKIQTAFLKYYAKNYKAEVKYETEKNGEFHFFIDDEDHLWDATGNAVFDCYDLDNCICTLEDWIANYYEVAVYQNNDSLMKDIEVTSIPKH